jgi:endoglucanase
MGCLTDPFDKMIYEMHQYLDSDGSGTSDTFVSSTIGAEGIADATAWLKANENKKTLWEFAAGANHNCYSDMTGMFDAMIEANDVWIEAVWCGPWWRDYIFYTELGADTGFENYFDTLAEYI